ncbi:hypothetical protein G4G27_15625 [Sphingomonas sp. So64.6b]|uniref:M64 family metallopeptidase n=1 Tax=Sphingomonas sp. So64.6b TaxID=2997354 RepID=UPI001600E2A8|nr:M64 family metallopeptidase [Sphingomonas sp. So64.6b]QNA85269.1 hypothetical protein G4G27_15625 [Sphingomonas sp. So64.6b]
MAEPIRQLIRLLIRVGPERPEIIDVDAVSGIAPQPDPPPQPGSRAFWIGITEPGAEPVFQRLAALRRHEETFEKGSWSNATSTRDNLVEIELPWSGDPEATLLVVIGTGEGQPESTAVSIASLGLLDPLRIPYLSQFTLLAEREIQYPRTDLNLTDNGKAVMLAFLPDGFVEAEFAAFHRIVADFIDQLRRTAPFDRYRDAIDAVMIDVPSAKSGIHDPLKLDADVDPWFGSGMGTGNMRRLIVAEHADRAISVARAAIGKARRIQCLIVANTSDYGGSGGTVAVFSGHSDSGQIAIHELGHSMFKLADEYSDDGNPFDANPAEPNVSAEPVPGGGWTAEDRGRLKWNRLLTPDIQLPTPPSAGPAVIGAFEGAKSRPEGLFRPTLDCKMRALTKPFCPVCSAAIAAALDPYLP